MNEIQIKQNLIKFTQSKRNDIIMHSDYEYNAVCEKYNVTDLVLGDEGSIIVIGDDAYYTYNKEVFFLKKVEDDYIEDLFNISRKTVDKQSEVSHILNFINDYNAVFNFIDDEVLAYLNIGGLDFEMIESDSPDFWCAQSGNTIVKINKYDRKYDSIGITSE